MPLPNELFSTYFPGTFKLLVNGHVEIDTVDATRLSLYRYRFTNSANMPGFRRKKRRELYGQPYQKNVRVLSDPAVAAEGVFDSPGYHEDHYRTVNVAWWSGNPQNIAPADDPSQRVANKIREILSETKTNTLVTAAELGKTADHLALTAKRVYEAYRSIRHGDFRGLVDVLGIQPKKGANQRFENRWTDMVDKTGLFHKDKLPPRGQRPTRQEMLRSRERMSKAMKGRLDYESFASSTWLEYSYAWKPLLGDVYNHAQALAELSIERAKVDRVVRARANTQSSAKRLDKGNIFQTQRESSDKRWVLIKCTYRLQGGDLNTFSQLGIDNPLEVAWELVPFSFVADWFLPVGNYLKSLTATNGLIFLNGEKMSRQHTVLTAELQSSGPWFTGVGITSWKLNGPAIQREESLSINREAILGFPAVEFPKLSNPFGKGSSYGLKKAISAISLLQSIFLK